MTRPRTALRRTTSARRHHPFHRILVHTWKSTRIRLFLMRLWLRGRRMSTLLRRKIQLGTKRRSTRFPPTGLRRRKLNTCDTVRDPVTPHVSRANTRLAGLFFNEFLKHVPIIHPVLGRKQITEDPQLATIACALGSLAANDVPSGYMCATWVQTYERLSAKVVRPSDILYSRCC